jgi:hypothetical protein
MSSKRVSSWPSTVSTQSISWCGDEMSAGSSADLASVGAAVLAAADAALLDDDEVAFVGAADAADAAGAAGAVSVDVIPSSGVRWKMEVSGSPRRAAKAEVLFCCCAPTRANPTRREFF